MIILVSTNSFFSKVYLSYGHLAKLLIHHDYKYLTSDNTFKIKNDILLSLIKGVIVLTD